MDKELCAAVINEIRESATEVVKVIAEAELALADGGMERMEAALINIIRTKNTLLRRLAVAAGTLEGKISNRGLLTKMWDKMKG